MRDVKERTNSNGGGVLGSAEDGMSPAKRSAARQPTSFTAPGYSTSGSPGLRGHMESGPPRFNLKG